MEQEPEATQTEGKNPKPKALISLGVAIAALLVIAIGIQIAKRPKMLTSSEMADQLMESMPDPSTYQSVEYCWEGTASSVDITMSTLSGGTSQQSDRANNQCIAMGDTYTDQFLYLSVQNKGRFGTIDCYIKVDGIEISRESSEGAYVIASCSA